MIHLFLISIATCAACATATEFFVSPNGQDHFPGTTPAQPFRSIQHAVNVAPTSNATIHVHHHNRTSAGELGELCVQNLLSGGSFEEDGTHWALLPSHLATIQSTTTHVGNVALQLKTMTGATTLTVARHQPTRVKATHQHRVRFWALVVGTESSNHVCGRLKVHFDTGSTTISTNVSVGCRIDYTWQYKEAWIPSYGRDGNITVEVELADTSGNYTLLVDDVSVVPFPGDQPVTFWSGTNLNGRCDSRQPLSGIVGHVNGAREENQYCEMHLNSGGWELFAMDGMGDKDQHRVTLANAHVNGVGAIASGT